MPRVMGIDYGSRRVGLAISDPHGRIASPLKTLDHSGNLDRLAACILHLADEWQVDEFVVGLPLNMDDSEGPQARATRAFGRALQERSDRPVHYWDERLSTHTADALLSPAELTSAQRRRRIDPVAAQVTLQSYLDASYSGHPAPDSDRSRKEPS